MKCPECKSELHCGCKACIVNQPDALNKMIKNYEKEESCSNCNLTMSVYEWFEEEGRQYDKMKELG